MTSAVLVTGILNLQVARRKVLIRERNCSVRGIKQYKRVPERWEISMLGHSQLQVAQGAEQLIGILLRAGGWTRGLQRSLLTPVKLWFCASPWMQRVVSRCSLTVVQ